MRSGINDLFSAGEEVVIRVGPLPFGAAADDAWTSFLARLGVRVPRPVRDTWEHAADGGVAVSAIERVHAQGDVDWREVGDMVRRVHAMDPGDWPELPRCVDFEHWQIGRLLDEVRGSIDDAALAGISATVDGWAGWESEAMQDPVVCHGDLHPGNVVPTVDGPCLLDWDLRCLGPVAWDHGPLMAWGERWDGSPAWYDAFAEGYGSNLRGDWLGECMADLRNVVATLLRVRAGRTDAAAAAEAERRLQYWRGDPDAPRWTPM